MHHIPTHWHSQERNREKKAAGQCLVYKILKGASLPEFIQPQQTDTPRKANLAALYLQPPPQCLNLTQNYKQI